ncbi:MAG TPA: hypothetical protein G4N92_05070 [Anaerolineae bacterium]|nr:hypothetical protein [Anaerolineae bacterium]
MIEFIKSHYLVIIAGGLALYGLASELELVCSLTSDQLFLGLSFVMVAEMFRIENRLGKLEGKSKKKKKK